MALKHSRSRHFLADRDGRAEEFHAEGVHPGGFEDVGAAARCSVVAGVEELFHLSGGGIGDEEAAGGVAVEGEGVGDTAGAEDGVSGLEGVELAADFDEIFALQDVEPFVLVVVEVARWASLGGVVVLHGEEVVAAVFGGDFEGGGAVGEDALEGVAVLGVGDGGGDGWGGGGGRSWRGGLGGLGEEAGGEGGGGQVEKGAAFEDGHAGAPLGGGHQYRAESGVSERFARGANDPP